MVNEKELRHMTDGRTIDELIARKDWKKLDKPREKKEGKYVVYLYEKIGRYDVLVAIVFLAFGAIVGPLIGAHIGICAYEAVVGLFLLVMELPVAAFARHFNNWAFVENIGSRGVFYFFLGVATLIAVADEIIMITPGMMLAATCLPYYVASSNGEKGRKVYWASSWGEVARNLRSYLRTQKKQKRAIFRAPDELAEGYTAKALRTPGLDPAASRDIEKALVILREHQTIDASAARVLLSHGTSRVVKQASKKIAGAGRGIKEMVTSATVKYVTGRMRPASLDSEDVEAQEETAADGPSAAALIARRIVRAICDRISHPDPQRVKNATKLARYLSEIKETKHIFLAEFSQPAFTEAVMDSVSSSSRRRRPSLLTRARSWSKGSAGEKEDDDAKKGKLIAMAQSHNSRLQRAQSMWVDNNPSASKKQRTEAEADLLRLVRDWATSKELSAIPDSGGIMHLYMALRQEGQYEAIDSSDNAAELAKNTQRIGEVTTDLAEWMELVDPERQNYAEHADLSALFNEAREWWSRIPTMMEEASISGAQRSTRRELKAVRERLREYVAGASLGGEVVSIPKLDGDEAEDGGEVTGQEDSKDAGDEVSSRSSTDSAMALKEEILTMMDKIVDLSETLQSSEVDLLSAEMQDTISYVLSCLGRLDAIRRDLRYAAFYGDVRNLHSAATEVLRRYEEAIAPQRYGMELRALVKSLRQDRASIQELVDSRDQQRIVNECVKMHGRASEVLSLTVDPSVKQVAEELVLESSRVLGLFGVNDPGKATAKRSEA